MSVHIPPIMLEKESGISSLDGEAPIAAAHDPTSGTSAATMGVLLMKAESVHTGPQSMSSATRVCLVLPSNAEASNPTAPRCSALLR